MNTEIKFISKRKDGSNWEYFLWAVTINGECFDYRMGLGHCDKFKRPTAPKVDQVLESLFSDARAGEISFDDFCADFGYDNDSIKALDTYRACMEVKTRLRKALGKDYAATRERIEAANA